MLQYVTPETLTDPSLVIILGPPGASIRNSGDAFERN